MPAPTRRKRSKSSSYGINSPCCSEAHPTPGSAGATAPSSRPSPGFYPPVADTVSWSPRPRSCAGTASSSDAIEILAEGPRSSYDRRGRGEGDLLVSGVRQRSPTSTRRRSLARFILRDVRRVSGRGVEPARLTAGGVWQHAAGTWRDAACEDSTRSARDDNVQIMGLTVTPSGTATRSPNRGAPSWPTHAGRPR
jgi:hypothetical protein